MYICTYVCTQYHIAKCYFLVCSSIPHVFLLSLSSARQLWRDGPADAGFVGDKAAVFGQTNRGRTVEYTVHSILQPRQRTHNVTLRRILVTVVVVEKNKYYIFWVCVRSPSYPERKEHEPYYIVICGLPASIKFFHIIS